MLLCPRKSWTSGMDPRDQKSRRCRVAQVMYAHSRKACGFERAKDAWFTRHLRFWTAGRSSSAGAGYSTLVVRPTTTSADRPETVIWCPRRSCCRCKKINQ